MNSLFSKFEENGEKYFLIVSLIVMVLLIFIQVVLRTFGSSIVWIEEVSRYIMLYQIWIGAAYAVKEDAHIRITSVVDKYTGEKRIKYEIVVLAIWLVFAIWLFIEGMILTANMVEIGQKSPALQIPMQIPYFSVPLGGFVMSLRLIQKLRMYFIQLQDLKLVELREGEK